MSFDPDKPYNALPLLPPRAELETKAVLRKAIGAKKALAELKDAGDWFVWHDIDIAPKQSCHKESRLTLGKAMTSLANKNSLWPQPLTTSW